jgi:7-cyano-7-deazaguanine synthase in queuosine biosynthesis
MKTVHGIDIHQGHCGLAFSGGADSAILLYILLSNVTDTLHLYSFYSKDKDYVSEPFTDRVLKNCVKLTGNDNVVHHKEYIETQTPRLVHNMLQSYVKRDNLVKMYNGVSKFPPDNVIEKFHENIRLEDNYVYQRRKNDLTHSTYFGENDFLYRPLVNFDKKDVANLYKLLNIESELFPLTRSCEDKNSPLQHCGRCFWCEERHWGFGYLE